VRKGRADLDRAASGLKSNHPKKKRNRKKKKKKKKEGLH
jgi:hypothetical protein